ncbi:MAG: hypothetical protein MUD01_25510, partial [Chloroflexaceae bacterium]|nr:hypothetical protein [Chloroflexaceae bacterium]
ADLLENLGPHAWRQFVWQWQAGPGQHTLVARATDVAGNQQPERVPFNQKGYLMNAWHRVEVNVMRNA